MHPVHRLEAHVHEGLPPHAAGSGWHADWVLMKVQHIPFFCDPGGQLPASSGKRHGPPVVVVTTQTSPGLHVMPLHGGPITSADVMSAIELSATELSLVSMSLPASLLDLSEEASTAGRVAVLPPHARKKAMGRAGKGKRMLQM
jgi:hypothetical protein